MSKVIKTTDSNITELLNAPICVLQFSAEWCGPCKMLGPIIDELAEANKDITIGKINVDENSEIAKEYGIRGIPTVLIFKDGSVIERLVGLTSKDNLQSKIDGLKA